VPSDLKMCQRVGGRGAVNAVMFPAY
jgi:hypothetical protein